MKRDAFPIASADAQGLNRRGFLRTATAAAAAVLVGEWSASLLSLDPRPPGEPVRLTDAGTLAPGEARALTLDGSPQAMLLVRLDAESLVAFDRRCPHLGCPVLWSASRERFECPCHAAAFDARTGAVLQGPPRRGLEPIGFELRGTEVWLRRRNEEKGVG
jgi:Rieske Fe-S protein